MLQPSVAKHVDLALFFLGKYDPTKLRVVLSTKLLPRPIRILYVKKSRCGEGTKLEARRPMLHRMVPMMAMIRWPNRLKSPVDIGDAANIMPKARPPIHPVKKKYNNRFDLGKID